MPRVSTAHSVVVHFRYGSTDLSRLFELERRIEADLEGSGIGLLDGDEVATSGKDGFLFLYGPSADALFERIRPPLESTDFMRGATVTLSYGTPGDSTPERTVLLP